MSLDLTMFDSSNLETANETVLSLYEKVRESHLKSEACRLRGLLPMVNADLARAVQRELAVIRQSARDRNDAAILEAVSVAIEAVKWALEAPQFLAAS